VLGGQFKNAQGINARVAFDLVTEMRFWSRQIDHGASQF
jgi:hypothetical protein